MTHKKNTNKSLLRPRPRPRVLARSGLAEIERWWFVWCEPDGDGEVGFRAKSIWSLGFAATTGGLLIWVGKLFVE